MKKGLFVILTTIVFNSYAQDTLPKKAEFSFPKNNLKINTVSLLAHTIMVSYERMVLKRLGVETEAGYIFPLNFRKYNYNPYSPFSEDPRPFFPSTGVLGRAGLRYYFLVSEKTRFLLFTGAGFVYKYRYYGKTYFYDWAERQSSYDRAIEQSQKNHAYAGEWNFGLRYYPKKRIFHGASKQMLVEASLGVNIGCQYRTTNIYAYYTGSNQYIPPNAPLHIEERKSYFTLNPCLKLGYAF